MSDQYDYIFSEPFLAVRHKAESRGLNGIFHNGPLLFTINHDPSRDAFSMLPVSWEVARTLAPKALDLLGEKLKRIRDLRATQEDAERQRDRVERLD